MVRASLIYKQRPKSFSRFSVFVARYGKAMLKFFAYFSTDKIGKIACDVRLNVHLRHCVVVRVAVVALIGGRAIFAVRTTRAVTASAALRVAAFFADMRIYLPTRYPADEQYYKYDENDLQRRHVSRPPCRYC